MTEIRNLRVLPRVSFTVVRNDAARDKALSFRARGLLVWMLSHETGRLITAAAMLDNTTEGRDAIRTALRELETARYIVRTRYRGKDGQWYHEMTVTDIPDTFTLALQAHAAAQGSEYGIAPPTDHRREKIENERASGAFEDWDRIG